MKLSISTCAHEQVRWQGSLAYTVEDALRACKLAGFDRVELGLAPYCRNGRQMTQDGWQRWVSGISEIVDLLGIKIGQVHGHFYSPKEWDEGDRAFHEEMLYRSAEAANMLNAECFVVHPDSVYEGGWYSRGKSIETNIGHIRELRRILKREAAIAVENMPNHQFPVRYGCGPEDLLEVVHDVSEAKVGVCWDFGHAVLAGVDQFKALDAIAPYLFATHVNDNNGIEDRHYLPFLYKGMIQWPPIMDKLKAVSYDYDFNFEVRFPFRGMPDALQHDLLEYARKTGEYLISLAV